ncbi:MAG TPA: MBL fold metallo-hydrolase, partial [Candidatus Brocadiia bacterium]|nr:MBL fold metallo-hydrolase [Candidatus Brocadiia bacterium]
MLGCDCKVCCSTDPRDSRGRASVLLKWDGHCVVVDTGAEFRQQALRERLMGVDAVLYTHAHADHIHGIDDLRAFSLRRPEPIPLYAADSTCVFLERTFRYIFSAPAGTPNIPRLQLRRVNGAFELLGRTVTPVPICHGGETILGFRVGGLAYLTDCSGVPEGSMALLAGLETLVIGALMPKPHEKHFSV